ncbi:MAG: OmpA family protein [Gemmatimonadota bacterium]
MGITRGWPLTAAAIAAISLSGCTHLLHKEDLEAQLDPMNAQLADHETRISTLESDMSGVKNDIAALRREMEQLSRDFNAHVSNEDIHGGMRVSLPVHFDFDAAEIRDVDKPLLDRFAAGVQRSYPSAVITVEGFSDPSGSSTYNLRLSAKRAENVKNYLVENGGLSADRVRTAAYGETSSRQVIPGAKGPGQSGIENRRVSFVVEWAGADN